MRLILALILTTTLLACAKPSYRITPQSEIYDFIFTSVYPQRAKGVLVLDQTDVKYLAGETLSNLVTSPKTQKIPKSLLIRFFKTNKSILKINWHPMVKAKLLPGDRIKLKTDNAPQFWQAFKNEFPLYPGFYTLSAVAFNTNKQQALVSLAYYCQTPCQMTQELFYVQKTIQEWRLQNRFDLAL